MLDEVVCELLKYDITDVSIFKPSYKKEITVFLKENGSRFNLLILFGGDGTFNEMVNGLMSLVIRPKILYVPSGTVNDLGKYLSLPKDYKKSFLMLKDKTTLIDICKVNEMYFSYVLACGKFTSVSYYEGNLKYKKALGKFYYYLIAIDDFFKPRNLCFTINGQAKEKSSLILLLNIWRVGNFKIRLKNKDKLNDGKINVVLIKNTLFFDVFGLILFLLFGIKLKGIVEVISGDRFKIRSMSVEQFNTDGEASYKTDNVDVVVIKEALEIYVSKKANDKYF